MAVIVVTAVIAAVEVAPRRLGTVAMEVVEGGHSTMEVLRKLKKVRVVDEETAEWITLSMAPLAAANKVGVANTDAVKLISVVATDTMGKLKEAGVVLDVEMVASEVEVEEVEAVPV